MEQCIGENLSTAVEITHEEQLDPPPYSPPPPYSLSPCSPPSYSPYSLYPQIQIDKECILSVNGGNGGVLTIVEGKVRIRPWERNALSQKWKIETASSRFGFRNQLNGKLLGVQNFNGKITANNEELAHWNLFCLDAIAGGFAFRIPAYLIWIEVFLVQPNLTDRLQASGRRNCTSIICIHYTNH
jgi:hypothetical protein